jgi:hypothetical protein
VGELSSTLTYEIAAADYRQLLRRGSVTRRLAGRDHEAWKRAIGSLASADELRVRTWSRDESASVWAVLEDWSPTREERERFYQRMAWQRED